MEVELSKKLEAQSVENTSLLEVQLRKSTKTPRVLTIWKSEDVKSAGVEDTHAQPTFGRSNVVSRERGKGFCTWSRVS